MLNKEVETYVRKLIKRSSKNGLTWANPSFVDHFLEKLEVEAITYKSPYTYVALSYADADGEGFAKKNPIDPERPAVGEKIAFARAFRTLEADMVTKATAKDSKPVVGSGTLQPTGPTSDFASDY